MDESKEIMGEKTPGDRLREAKESGDLTSYAEELLSRDSAAADTYEAKMVEKEIWGLLNDSDFGKEVGDPNHALRMKLEQSNAMTRLQQKET